MSTQQNRHAAPREPVAVTGDTVSAGTTERYTYVIPKDAVVTGLRVHCYKGQEHDLKYEVNVNRTDGTSRSLVEFVGNDKTISGNDDLYEFDLRRNLAKDDELEIVIENKETQYDYTANAVVSVDYEPGVLASLRSKIGGI